MNHQTHDRAGIATLPPAEETPEVKAWEQVDAGRFMPRRVRGKLPGPRFGLNLFGSVVRFGRED